MLFPIENETREIKDLSGIWSFKVDWKDEGFKKEWFKRRLEATINMPVPSSYNDITQESAIRDFVGNVWYERNFFVPESWRGRKISIYFGSVTHRAIVFVNGEKVTEHNGGFLPFQADVTSVVKYGSKNRLTVVVNNVLGSHSLPPGKLIDYHDEKHPPGFRVQQISFDFFNYSGIHRPVKLVSYSLKHITDITISTEIDSSDGVVNYSVSTTDNSLKVLAEILENGEKIVASTGELEGSLRVSNASLWSTENPYLYDFSVKLFDRNNALVDTYCLPFGIRTIKVSGDRLLLNDKPIYLKGFGMHEDMDIKGKGFDYALMIKNFNLLKWINANSVRTSHYPYAEEFLYYADRQGILVIDELPAVGMNANDMNTITMIPDNSKSGNETFFDALSDNEMLNNHIKTLEEMISRDKNHPSVIVWSIANEASTYEKKSEGYFLELVKRAKELDATRPITIIENSSYDTTRVSQYVDIVSINRYYSWYEDPGHLEIIEYQLERDVKNWHKRFNKPILISEYGADAIAGLHADPPVMFSEEYQIELLKRYHKIFDKLDFIIGGHVWNFADFKTKQSITRVDGNKKGIFTRQRQPKSAAFYLKSRWENK